MKKHKDNEDSFQITDQHGELLLECKVGDKYHKALLEAGMNTILKDMLDLQDRSEPLKEDR